MAAGGGDSDNFAGALERTRLLCAKLLLLNTSLVGI
jgi:hypothetical protein